MASDVAIKRMLWKKAMHDTITLDLLTDRSARTFRLALYQAVRKVKTGEDLTDVELADAVAQIEIAIGNKPGQLILRKKTGSLAMLEACKALGITTKEAEYADMPADVLDLMKNGIKS